MRLPLALRRIEGRSMMPGLLPGRVVLVTRWYSPIQIGDIVVIQHDGLEKIKRVTKINGQQVFVSGDNSLKSTDSKDFGWIENKVVTAKLLWPRA